MRQGVSLAVGILFFCLSKVALSQAQDLTLSTLIVPSDLGQVSQRYPTDHPSAHTKLLLLIQDTHVNYESQKHVAQLLDRFASDYGLRLVLLEGGSGNANLAYLRGLGSPAARKAVAEEYLQEGILSGAEYLDVVSDHPLVLWGVDDEALYDENVDRFMEVEQLRERLAPQLEQLRQLVDQLRAHTTNEALKAFETQQARFAKQEVAFSVHLRYLAGEGERLGVPVSGYPQLTQMLQVVDLETGLVHDQADLQQQELMKRLGTATSDVDLARLREAVSKLNTETITPAAFYRELEDIAGRAQVSLERYPQLARYIQYVRLKDTLQFKMLWSELAELQARIKERLVGQGCEAELASISEGVSVFQRLIELTWLPTNYQAYLKHAAAWRFSRWLPALREEADRQGMASTLPEDGQALDERIAEAVRFYEVADRRNAEMIRRALEKMDQEGEQVAALITGGFHTDDLARLLAQEHIDVAVITPWVSQETDKRQYADVLKMKQHAKRSFVTATRGMP